MSGLQLEEGSNDASITGNNDGVDRQLGRLFLRYNKSVMKIARYRACRMAILHQTPFETELPKALKEVISKLSAEFRKRKQNRENGSQIKLQGSENTETSCNIGEAEKNEDRQAEFSQEIKLILRLRPDIAVDQAIIKQRVLNELKESSAKGNTASKQSNELPKTEKIKPEARNNENISQ